MASPAMHQHASLPASATRVVTRADIMDRLPAETLRQTFHYVEDDCNGKVSALLPLAQVSRTFLSVATPLLYRVITIKPYNSQRIQCAKS